MDITINHFQHISKLFELETDAASEPVQSGILRGEIPDTALIQGADPVTSGSTRSAEGYVCIYHLFKNDDALPWQYEFYYNASKTYKRTPVEQS